MEMNDWDVEINDAEVQSTTNEKTEFTILPKGTYKFAIAKVNHVQYQPKEGKTTGITAPCKKIELGIIIDGGAMGKAWADDNLYAWPTCLYRILSVLKSIGEIQDGFKGKIGDHLDALKGSEGVCEVDTEEYTSRKSGEKMTKNVITRYYKPNEKFTLSVGDAGEDF